MSLVRTASRDHVDVQRLYIHNWPCPSLDEALWRVGPISHKLNTLVCGPCTLPEQHSRVAPEGRDVVEPALGV